MSSGFNMFKNWQELPVPVGGKTVSVVGLVPETATGVVLHLSNQGYRAQACVHAPGFIVEPTWFQLNWGGHAFAYSGLKDLAFEAHCENLAYRPFEGNPVKVQLCGYTDEAVQFLPAPIQKGSGICDCSGEVPSNATGGIWLVYNSHPTTGRPFGIRGYGSTDQHWGDTALWGVHATHIVSIDGEANSFIYALIAFGEYKKIQFIDRANDGYVKPYLIGYTKPPVQFLLDCKPVSYAGPGWKLIGVPGIPAEADGVIVEIRTTSLGRKRLSIRSPGSTNSDPNSYLGLETAIWGACGLSLGEFEGFGEWPEKTMFFIHGYTMPAGAPQEFSCPYCGHTFPTQEALNQHILNEHTFPCPHCSEIFHSQEELDTHIASEHHFECPHCGAVFPTQAALDNHIFEEHHFVCPYCQAVFPSQEELDQHIANEHPQPPANTTITITQGYLTGNAQIEDGRIVMEITEGHIEGEITQE